MPLDGAIKEFHDSLEADGGISVRVERHTEFVTVTRVRKLDTDPERWPEPDLSEGDFARLAGLTSPLLVCHVSILVLGNPPGKLESVLNALDFGDTAASSIGGGAAQVCSDFRVRGDNSSRIILFNKDLNAHRLGRMVRRIFEIETYRSMALLGLPEARRLAPLLSGYDADLVQLTNRNLSTPAHQHKQLLEEITVLSSHIISATAETRNRFGATAAYAKIVEERIALLRETHVPGYQRFGTFVERRFKPAVRTCEATALRLEQLSRAAMHLLDLLQTRIQVEIEFQNATQIQAMADRAATQVKIQRAVESFSIIAISYYLLSLLKFIYETAVHAGFHIDPVIMLVAVPIVVGAVAITILRVKHALKAES
ncbi:putative membrane-anchored protein [Rhizobium azibense]|nr:putative membrane-anchored protein [Rhizobium azibense]